MPETLKLLTSLSVYPNEEKNILITCPEPHKKIIKMKKYTLLMIVMLTALLFSACGFNIIRGSGDMITETREVSDFDKVVLACSGDIIPTQGEE